MTTTTIERTATVPAAVPEHASDLPVATARHCGDHVRIESGAFAWQSALAGAPGGPVETPEPTAFLLAALAGCTVTYIRETLAPELHIDAWDVRATARCEIGVGDASHALQRVVLEVEVFSPYNERVVQRLFDAWRERCPAYLAFTTPTAVEVECRAAPQ